MPKHPNIWVVLADGGHAKIVTPTDDGSRYRLVIAFDSPDAHHLTHDLVSDRPGRTFESANAAHHAVAPRHDPHDLAKQAFVRLLADHLNKAAEHDEFDELILFAPGHVLHDLRDGLHTAATGKVTLSAPKDLTKLPFAELPSHIEKLRQD